MRALVLADDPGLRMRPLTGALPKALLPITGEPLLHLALSALAQAGCEAALVRVGPLGSTIENRFGTSLGAMELHYCSAPSPGSSRVRGGDPESHPSGGEEEGAGPLRQLKDFLAGAEVAALLPANRVCRWPLKRLVKRHIKGGAAATLLVGKDRPWAPAITWVELEKKGKVSELRGRSTAIEPRGEVPTGFLGACLLDATALLETTLDPVASRSSHGVAGCGNGATLLGLLRGWLAQGRPLLGVGTRRPVFELPTPVRYLDAVREWSRTGRLLGLGRRRFVSVEAQLEKHVRILRSVVEAGAVLERGSRIEDSLVLGGSTVGAGSRIEHSIVAPGVLLSPRTRLSGRLVTPLKSGRAPGANDSVVGDLVYTPLGRG